jgi:hypothetical protein
MVAGRKSLYDNDFYLSSTYPPSLSSTMIVLSASQRASMAIMHIFIQCPRLSCLVRDAIAHPDSPSYLVSAIALAESLWQLDLSSQVAPLLSEAVTISTRPVRGLTDIVTSSLSFDSIQSIVLCTRYWLLINVIGGLVDTLYRHFPTETALSLLPDRYLMHIIETDAAMQLVRSMPWADSLSKTMPLVPLRLHTPLQISIGPWHRNILRLSVIRDSTPDLDPDVNLEISRTIAHAQRMESWIVEECNRIHRQWDVSLVAAQPLFDILETMAGGIIPDWMPVRVRFEAEDGEMVMKLDYENKTGTYQEHFDIEEHPPRKASAREAVAWSEEAGIISRKPFQSVSDDTDVKPLPGTFEGSYRNESMEPRKAANFIHGTGRNLCSTSGWWPSSENTTTAPLDNTSDDAEFSLMQALMDSSADSALRHHAIDRSPGLAPWLHASYPSTPSFDNTPQDSGTSAIWPGEASQITAAFDNRPKSDRISPGWTGTELAFAK